MHSEMDRMVEATDVGCPLLYEIEYFGLVKTNGDSVRTAWVTECLVHYDGLGCGNFLLSATERQCQSSNNRQTCFHIFLIHLFLILFAFLQLFAFSFPHFSHFSCFMFSHVSSLFTC